MKQFVVTLTAFSVSDYTQATAHTFLTNEHRFFFLFGSHCSFGRAHIYEYMHRNYAEVLNYIGMSSSWLQACVCVEGGWVGGGGGSVGVGCKQSRSHLQTISAPALYVQVVRALLSPRARFLSVVSVKHLCWRAIANCWGESSLWLRG